MADPGISTLFGLAVREKRAATKQTQESLAERAGLHPTYISMVERGVRNPTLEAANAIATALGISLPALLAEALELKPRKSK